MDNIGYWLFLANAIVWIGLGCYLIFLGLGQKRLAENLRQLEILRDEHNE